MSPPGEAGSIQTLQVLHGCNQAVTTWHLCVPREAAEHSALWLGGCYRKHSGKLLGKREVRQQEQAGYKFTGEPENAIPTAYLFY